MRGASVFALWALWAASVVCKAKAERTTEDVCDESVDDDEVFHITMDHMSEEQRNLINHALNILGGVLPLHVAASQGYVDGLEVLIASGVPVDQRSTDGVTALHVAADHGLPKVARLLLRHGADVDAATHVGETALWRAASAGHAAVVKALIEHGATVDATEKQLGWASRQWSWTRF